MEKENYELLLQTIDAQNKKIEALEKRVTDVCALNETLMNTSGAGSSTQREDATQKKNDLEKKLREGIKRGL